jgi:hypothetical protein
MKLRTVKATQVDERGRNNSTFSDRLEKKQILDWAKKENIFATELTMKIRMA